MSIVAMATAGAFAQEPAGVGEIRALMDSGDFQAAVTKIDKQLFPSSKDQADRYPLLMLKGECEVQLKDRMGAVTAFKSAAKAAGDVNQLAAARANALILEKSSLGTYKPPFAGGEEPIDIVAI